VVLSFCCSTSPPFSRLEHWYEGPIVGLFHYYSVPEICYIRSPMANSPTQVRESGPPRKPPIAAPRIDLLSLVLLCQFGALGSNTDKNPPKGGSLGSKQSRRVTALNYPSVELRSRGSRIRSLRASVFQLEDQCGANRTVVSVTKLPR
jgi:hypothetical protein